MFKYSIYLIIVIVTCLVSPINGQFANIPDIKLVGKWFGDSSQVPIYEPGTENSIPNEQVQLWYTRGLADCNEYLAKHKEQYSSTHVPPFYVQPQHIGPSGQRSCRGNAALYQETGAITWIFGPNISQTSKYICPVNTNCWFGILTCDGSTSTSPGTTKHDALKSLFFKEIKEHTELNWFKNSKQSKSTPPSMTTHNQYYYHNKSYGHSSLSPRGFHFNMRIIGGSETISPYVRYRSILIDNTLVDVIIANYTITIPSTINSPDNVIPMNEMNIVNGYELEVRMLWLYTGALFNFPLVRSPSTSSKSGIMRDGKAPGVKYLEPGWWKHAALFLGGSEYRCSSGGDANCGVRNDCCGCDALSLVANTPLPITSPIFSVPTEPILYALDTLPSNAISNPTPTPLPLCRNGNHPGRWITMDTDILDLCHAKDYWDQSEAIFAKRDYTKLAGIYKNYLSYAQASNSEFVINYNKLIEKYKLEKNMLKLLYFQELSK